jgi:hypothetical protein
VDISRLMPVLGVLEQRIIEIISSYVRKRKLNLVSAKATLPRRNTKSLHVSNPPVSYVLDDDDLGYGDSRNKSSTVSPTGSMSMNPTELNPVSIGELRKRYMRASAPEFVESKQKKEEPKAHQGDEGDICR